MQDPVYCLKIIIDDAIDLYRAVKDEKSFLTIEELMENGKNIKEKPKV